MRAYTSSHPCGAGDEREAAESNTLTAATRRKTRSGALLAHDGNAPLYNNSCTSVRARCYLDLNLPCPVQRTLQLRAFVFSFAPPTPRTSSFRVRMGELRLPPWHPAGLACDDFAGFLKSPYIWLTVHAFISGSFVCFNGHNHRSRWGSCSQRHNAILGIAVMSSIREQLILGTPPYGIFEGVSILFSTWS